MSQNVMQRLMFLFLFIEEAYALWGEFETTTTQPKRRQANSTEIVRDVYYEKWRIVSQELEDEEKMERQKVAKTPAGGLALTIKDLYDKSSDAMKKKIYEATRKPKRLRELDDMFEGGPAMPMVPLDWDGESYEDATTTSTVKTTTESPEKVVAQTVETLKESPLPKGPTPHFLRDPAQKKEKETEWKAAVAEVEAEQGDENKETDTRIRIADWVKAEYAEDLETKRLIDEARDIIRGVKGPETELFVQTAAVGRIPVMALIGLLTGSGITLATLCHSSSLSINRELTASGKQVEAIF
eukprot:gnl/MRDRNA2_/MRDRNA2_68204_c0_seq1.p1 gnl/MRDRNA2_/MRDRNA2_68204_c0~~gnl/MRDRNA2_/MRDRNA2_68204_c0_seq1.p1  ORF type:complete len:298 (+),score=76.65 gnl/MRDRNA2_/MRDRNA2_68204_c0_seq1:222-1115(+)